MTFSIIIPLYNKAPYINKAIESVLGQTFGDFELIIIDNGSTDGSGKKASAFSDPRIVFRRLEENMGVSNARNMGVRMSKSPYITFLDADDWWEPTFLEEMAGLIGRHPSAGIWGTSYHIVKNRHKRLAPIGVDKGFAEGEINYCQVYAKTLCMPLCTGTICVPRTIFDKIGGFPPSINLGEDFILWIHVALSHPVVLLNKPLSNYNQDVDPSARATCHLHAPEHHMLWNLRDLEPLESTNADYKQLVDNLRTYSLFPYYLDKRYRNAAQQELSKVDWSRQPVAVRRRYRLPVWYLSAKTNLLRTGVMIKQYFRQRANCSVLKNS